MTIGEAALAALLGAILAAVALWDDESEGGE